LARWYRACSYVAAGQGLAVKRSEAADFAGLDAAQECFQHVTKF
jgi:hypothetical protein